jgi:hypothetical protein
MPGDINIFADHCVFIRSVYRHLEILFVNSTENYKKRMLHIAQFFFEDLNNILVEYIILTVCKITDPAQDNRKNDNHTIDYLIKHYDCRADVATAERLDRLCARIKAFRKKLLPARNKLIAHSDRKTIMEGTPLGATEPGEWDQFWHDLDDVVLIIQEKALVERCRITEVAMLSDADSVLRVIRDDD